MNKLSFPKIDPKVFDREGLKECYVFKPNKGDKNCPTVIHFVLVNINFRTFKAPGNDLCEQKVLSVALLLYWKVVPFWEVGLESSRLFPHSSFLVNWRGRKWAPNSLPPMTPMNIHL